jgi:hypothetical protein
VTEVEGKLDTRLTPPRTLVVHDPAIETAGAEVDAKAGARPLGGTLASAGGAALEIGHDRRLEMESLWMRGADALASCSPYERGALERAVDRFLEQLGGADAISLPGQVPVANMIPGAVVVAATLLAIETLRRRARNDRDGSGGGGTAEALEHSGFPGLPARRRIWALEER